MTIYQHANIGSRYGRRTIDVHVDTVRNWEAGYCKAAGASIDTICAVLSCTPADLQGTTEV